MAVRNLDDELLGFYVGVDDDWCDGIISKRDSKGRIYSIKNMWRYEAKFLVDFLITMSKN